MNGPSPSRERRGAGSSQAAVSHCGGFTFLEVLVALTLAAVVLLAVHKLNAQSILVGRETGFHAAASLLAQEKAADIESTLPDLPTARTGDFGGDYPGYRWEIDVEAVSAEPLGEVAEDLYRIDVVVTEDAEGRSFRLRTYRFNR